MRRPVWAAHRPLISQGYLVPSQGYLVVRLHALVIKLCLSVTF